MRALSLLPFLLSAHAFSWNPFRSRGELSDRELREIAVREIEERLVPITATRTVYVYQTETNTVWVEPTGQVVFPLPSTSATPSAFSSASYSSSISSISDGLSVSADPSGSMTDSSVSVTSSASSSAESRSARSRSESGSGTRGHPSPSQTDVSGSASLPLESASSSSVASLSSAAPSGSATSVSFAPSASDSFSFSDTLSASATPSASESLSVSFSSDFSASFPSASLSASASAYSFSASVTASMPMYSASSTSSAGGPTKTPSAGLPDKIMNGYYADWASNYLMPEDIDWSKFDVVDFAFALPDQYGNLQFTQWNDDSLLKSLVSTGHAAGKRVKLSIGGWTGSAYFSSICQDDGLRATFVSNILNAYNGYNLDGIDIDWEYPGVQGAAGNAVSGSDSDNFLTFLQDLRAALPDGAIISTATQVWPFADSNGNPMTDVSGFAEVLDYILIMNYDIWGSSSDPGPNAPLSDNCGNSTQPLANAYAAVASWTAAGMPANKITLGVPAYGYLQYSSATSLRQRRSMLTRPPRRGVSPRRSHQPNKRDVTVQNDNGGSGDGQVMFEELISQGAIAKDSSGHYVGANGFTRYWDDCSSTPWLKSESSGQVVTYDDPMSMSLKGQFALQAGIRGCNVFSMDGDWTGSSWPLTDAVRSGMGL